MGPTSSTMSWPRNGEMDSPFKTLRSPLRDLPSGDTPHWIAPDPAHTYAIGWGKDFVASSILLMVHMGLFGATGSLQKKLDTAFGLFKTWCREHHKTTSLTTFSMKVFKIQSSLGRDVHF